MIVVDHPQVSESKRVEVGHGRVWYVFFEGAIQVEWCVATAIIVQLVFVVVVVVGDGGGSGAGVVAVFNWLPVVEYAETGAGTRAGAGAGATGVGSIPGAGDGGGGCAGTIEYSVP